MFRAHRAHHQERQIVSIQPLVTVTLCWCPRRVQVAPEHDANTNTGNQETNPTKPVHFQPAYDKATNTVWQLPEVVLTQLVSPDDEHDVLETCRELKIKVYT